MVSSNHYFTLKKNERLSKKKEIEFIFSKGRSFVIFPFKFLFLQKNQNHASILFTIPKRNFKRAVDRNSIKRQLKEVYRQNKLDNNLSVAIIFLSKEKIPFNFLKNKLILGLHRLNNEMEKKA